MDMEQSENLSIGLYVFSAIMVFIVSFFMELRFPMSSKLAKLIGILTIIIGMSLVVWAAGYIRGAFMGEVKPILDRIVKKGPYRLIRHPVYLGMTIALSGIPITLKSWPGILSVFIFFLPSVIYRARLEEKALAEKFGKDWQDYVRITNFIIPFVKRHI